MKSFAQGLRHMEGVLVALVVVREALRNRMAHLQVLIPSAQLFSYMR
jgi:hypothetical protein